MEPMATEASISGQTCNRSPATSDSHSYTGQGHYGPHKGTHGAPWDLIRSHGSAMEPHQVSWGRMDAHGDPWGPWDSMGAAPVAPPAPRDSNLGCEGGGGGEGGKGKENTIGVRR